MTTHYQHKLDSASREAKMAAGLALIIAIYRHYKTANVDEVNSLKG
jgi:NADH:ubiquinone oxidoreductase subunit K